MSSAEIRNALRVNDRLVTAGQPTEAQLRALASEGFEAVINLAPTKPGQPPEDEAGLLRSLGLAYEHIPVDWAAPQDSDLLAFEQAMRRHAGKRLLVHCALNFRATAFVSLHGLKHEGWTPQQAESLRAAVWAGSDYPAWKDFIARHTPACGC